MTGTQRSNGNERERAYKQKYSKRIRNHAGAVLLATVTAAAAAAVLLANRCECEPICDKPQTVEEGPKVTRGDHICIEALEGYPYKRNADGTVMKGEDGKPVKNPNYSKEDCSANDNVCDSNPKELKDPAGNKIEDLMEKYTDGTPVNIQEDEESPDCVREKVRENPCKAYTTDDDVLKDRPLVSISTEAFKLAKRGGYTAVILRPGLVQRTQEEVAEMHSNPQLVKPGDNHYVMYSAYEETCDPKLDLCTLASTDACFCHNHIACKAYHKKKPLPKVECGNGKVERGEQCEKEDDRCAPNEECKACQCVPKGKPPPVCGNGEIEAGEQCETNTDPCGEDKECKSCRCVDKKQEKPGPCKPGTSGSPQAKGIKRDAANVVLSRSGDILAQTQLPNDGVSKFTVNITINVNAQGEITGASGSPSCIGCVSQYSGMGSLNSAINAAVSGRKVPAPEKACYMYTKGIASHGR